MIGDHYCNNDLQRTKSTELSHDGGLQLPKVRSSVTVPKPKRMDEVSMDLRTIARGADVVEHILAVLEDLRALSEFPEEGVTKIVLIASEFDLEREGARQDGRCEVAAAKGIDGPTETQNLLGVARKFVIR